jgi:hypothetical protein
MDWNRFHGLYLVTFLLFIATVILSRFNMIVSGVVAISAILVYRETVTTANKKGKDRSIKVMLLTQKNILFLGLIGVAGLISTVPTYLSVLSLFSFGLLSLTHSDIKNQLNRTYEMTFSHVEIGLIAAITILISGFNPHFGFWGLLLVTMVSTYQEAELIARSTDLRSRI